MKKPSKIILLITLLTCGCCALIAQNEDKALEFFNSGDYQNAAVEFENALPSIATVYCSSDTSYYSKILIYTAVSFANSQQEVKAIEYYTRAITIYKELGAGFDTYYIISIENLALLHYNAGRYEEAAPLYETAMNIRKLAFSNLSPEYLISVNSLAVTYGEMGKYDLAEPLYTEVLSTRKTVLGEDHPDYMISLSNLALLQYNVGNFEKAETLYTQLMNIRKKNLGEDHPEYAQAVNSLGVIYYNLENYEKAELLYIEAIEIRKRVIGEDHPDYVRSVNNLGVLYIDMHVPAKAVPLHLEAMNIRKKTLGDSHPDYVQSMSNLALAYERMRKYSSAEPLYIEALSIRKKIFGENHPDYGESLSALARLYDQMGLYEKAMPLFEAARNIRKTALGEGHPDYATVLFDFAMLYKNMGNDSKAEELLLEACNIYKNAYGEENSDYASALNKLGAIYSDMGMYAQADKFMRKALNIRKKILGEEHPDYITSLNDMAGLYATMGNYSKALPMYIEAMNSQRKGSDEDNLQYAISLNNLAFLYVDMGNYSKAESLYLEAIPIRKKILGEEHPYYALTLNNLASFYKLMGNYSKAIPLYIEAMDIRRKALGEEHPDYAQSLGNLANLYSTAGNHAKAEPMYVEALNINKKSLGEEHPVYATNLSNLAASYYYQGKYDQAEQLYNEALKISKKAFGEWHVNIALKLSSLASLYIKNGNYSKAEEMYLEVLNIYKKNFGEAHPDYAMSLVQLAALYEYIEKPAKAEPFMFNACKIYLDQLSGSFEFMSEKEQSQYLYTFSSNFDSYNSLVTKLLSSDRSFVKNVYNNELILKGALLNASSGMREAILNCSDSLLKTKYVLWEETSRQVASLRQQPIAKRFANADSLEEVANILEKDLMRESTAFNEERETKLIDYDEVNASLSNAEAAVEFISFYYHNGRRWTDSIYYYAVVIRKGNVYPEMVFLCEEKSLAEKLKNENGSAENSRVDNIYAANRGGKTISLNPDETYSGTSLYSLLWKPLDSLLVGVTTVWLSPTGLLHKISFNAITGYDSIPLIDKYAINYVSSTREVVHGHDDLDLFAKGSSADFYGGINYEWNEGQTLISGESDDLGMTASTVFLPEGSTSRGGIVPLPGTLKEVKKLRGLFSKHNIAIQLYTGDTASETRFKLYSHKQSPTLIHFATHGFYFEKPKTVKQKVEVGEVNFRGLENQPFLYSDNPMVRSGLLMAGASRKWSGEEVPVGNDDGILTALEISNLNLSNTKLVVLSACETGLGDISGSEGIFGLQRSLKMAGVKYIVESLWQVPDEQTVELMTLFYNGCFSGLPIREAFREAQMTLSKKYSPYYWAAFVLIE